MMRHRRRDHRLTMDSHRDGKQMKQRSNSEFQGTKPKYPFDSVYSVKQTNFTYMHLSLLLPLHCLTKDNHGKKKTWGHEFFLKTMEERGNK